MQNRKPRKTPPPSVAEGLLRFKEERRLTWEGVARRAGVTVDAVHRWRRYENAATLLRAATLAGMLEMTVDEVLTDFARNVRKSA